MPTENTRAHHLEVEYVPAGKRDGRGGRPPVDGYRAECRCGWRSPKRRTRDEAERSARFHLLRNPNPYSPEPEDDGEPSEEQLERMYGIDAAAGRASGYAQQQAERAAHNRGQA